MTRRGWSFVNETDVPLDCNTIECSLHSFSLSLQRVWTLNTYTVCIYCMYTVYKYNKCRLVRFFLYFRCVCVCVLGLVLFLSCKRQMMVPEADKNGLSLTSGRIYSERRRCLLLFSTLMAYWQRKALIRSEDIVQPNKTRRRRE